MTDKAIIYYTDNSLSEDFAIKVRAKLKEAAGGIQIISVSQKPIDFGQNICVGEIGRSHLSIYKQIEAGLSATDTKTVYMAEHDCLYSPEHFRYNPPNDNTFYYNVNCWFAQLSGRRAGRYSYFRRRALSNLICNRLLLKQAIAERTELLAMGVVLPKGQPGACEPGCCDKIAFTSDGLDIWNRYHKDFSKEPTIWKAKAFRTETANLDIRHGSNFSGGRSAKKKTNSLPYWGTFPAALEPRDEKIHSKKWYQNITINGIDMPAVGLRSKHSRFAGQGKWDTFIKPMLSFDDFNGRTFVETGCNAGLFLINASKLGFDNVTGIEADESYFAQAEYHLAEKGFDNIRLLNRTVGNDFDFNEIPAADLTLLSNFHYWLDDKQAKQYISDLSRKSLFCIVIGRVKNNKKHTSKCDIATCRQHFADDWHEVKTTENVSTRGDPVPKRLYSILFKSKRLKQYKTEPLHNKQQFMRSTKYLATFQEFNSLIFAGEDFDVTKTSFYDYVVWRKKWGGRGETRTSKRVEQWRNLAADIKANGLKRPLVMRKTDDKILDGMHRLIIAQQLKHPHILAEMI